MGNFRKVEVHFPDGGVSRVVGISKGAKSVKAIFLRGSESDFVIRSKKTGKVISSQPGIPRGVTIRPRPKKGEERGPGQVCYLEDDVMVCWRKR